MKLKHLAIIPDGNRRWARAHNLPTLEGHRRGYNNMLNIGKWAINRGIEHVSVWGFSTENWKRSEKEVGYLMKLILKAIRDEVEFYKKEDIRVRVIGSRDELSTEIVEAIEFIETETSNHSRGQLNLCINYGGRAEILEATKKLMRDDADPETLTEEQFTAATWLADIPPVDLIIRTSGEKRLSGFMSWSGGYAELHFIDKHFPDMNEHDLDEAIEEFENRQRRYGK